MDEETVDIRGEWVLPDSDPPVFSIHASSFGDMEYLSLDLYMEEVVALHSLLGRAISEGRELFEKEKSVGQMRAEWWDV
jgi:hypothetical protein